MSIEPEAPASPEQRRHPAVIATAIALPVALLVGVIVAAVTVSGSGTRPPEALGPVDAPLADSSDCATLLAGLPAALGDYDAADLVDPAPIGARAWAPGDETSDPVVLRCGLPRPNGFDVASSLQVINGVQWFEVSGADSGIDASTWYAVDRAVYVALTVPNGSGPTPLQDASNAISATLPQTALDPAPLQ
ncbi:DUF3515 domain-containing protein [Rhodococcus sp. G-MC3]|uniref:DUF3515 domain-containing protein n=1 Tax=Rhodococcus sp. G-MC3 TaxID=3046209 RepID=UPI0024B8A3E1|nr:DUF3515 domain-containing protein [Rhodococcus sp. G-MC3]MDJ0391960.1 DUF3515 domain-containing protein [Rhodococcus sp. G-MC3]